MTMNRKVLLVDLDNVVYPFIEVMALLCTMEGLVNNTPSELLQLYSQWAVWTDWGISESGFNRVWERGILSGDVWGLGERVTANPIHRAIKNLWDISENEWHIHLVTHRLNKFRLHDAAVANTAKWLEWANIPYRGLTFTKDKHSILGDAIIDDNPDNLEDHPAPLKILYPSPHNLGWREAHPKDYANIVAPLEGEGIYPWDEITEKLGSGVRE